jgi:hypothetical protein
VRNNFPHARPTTALTLLSCLRETGLRFNSTQCHPCRTSGLLQRLFASAARSQTGARPEDDEELAACEKPPEPRQRCSLPSPRCSGWPPRLGSTPAAARRSRRRAAAGRAQLTLFARHRPRHALRTRAARPDAGFPPCHPVPARPSTGHLRASLWAALAPASALLCLGVAETTPWFIAFLLLTVAGPVGQPSGSPPSWPPRHAGVLGALPATALCHGPRGKTRERLADAHRQLRQEQERSERLLLNILPAPIAARLKDNSVTIADGHPEVVVMFADIVDYTRIASGMTPAVFEMLNRIFCRFDELSGHHGLERIKTIGDGYMVAGGLHAHPTRSPRRRPPWPSTCNPPCATTNSPTASSSKCASASPPARWWPASWAGQVHLRPVGRHRQPGSPPVH